MSSDVGERCLLVCMVGHTRKALSVYCHHTSTYRFKLKFIAGFKPG